MLTDFTPLTAEARALCPVRALGRVQRLRAGLVEVSGLGARAALGDLAEIAPPHAPPVAAEVVRLSPHRVTLLPEEVPEGLRLGLPVQLRGPGGLAPDDAWLGRVIDPMGQPLDGRVLFRGPCLRPWRAPPPPPATRRAMGPRLDTGLAVFDTLLPLARGQRLGLFAGAGVGKSTLLGQLARGVEADVVVVALVGERGRELRHVIDAVLGPETMARSVVVAATSDRSALTRRRCVPAALAVAEHFRDAGRHVLLLVDSLSRFADAHREVALAAGEPPALGGYPPSLAHALMSLAERAGPGTGRAGDITALFSVLVAGSDMEAPVADILRGTLDGHVVLSRAVAERGRFPAVDLPRSVSRSLPDAATPAENRLIGRARAALAAYDAAEVMIGAGLYQPGGDARLDAAVALWPGLDAFLAEAAPDGVDGSFARLAAVLGPESASAPAPGA